MDRALALPSERRPRYIDASVEPLVFPVQEEVPETQLHMELRTLLYQLLKDHLGAGATVGSDQFIYYNAADPKQVLAPDVYVCTRPQPELVTSWKVWERGTPQIAVEVVSPSDSRDLAWDRKLERYHALGVQELLRFNPELPADEALEVWDRVDGRLLQREPSLTPYPSLVLGLHWLVASAEGHACALRIGTGETGETLVLTRAERAQAEAQARQVEAQARQVEAQARQVAESARDAAQARIEELEKLVASLSKKQD